MRMKRLTSFLLALTILLTMIPSAFAQATAEGAPNQIDSTTVWSYLDDNTDPAGDSTAEGYDRTSWTTADFDDSTWKTASGSFGTKEGKKFIGADNQLAGCPGDETNYPVYYFRTEASVADASNVVQITGTISYDDAVILYINGVKVKGFNDEGCDSNTSFCTNIASASPVTEAFTITDDEALAALKDGVNVVAVELHNRANSSSDIYFALPDMTFSTEAPPTNNALLNGTENWSYLDDNTDPAGDFTAEGYDRTSWTTADFDDSTWKTAAGSFGSKRGADNLENGYTANKVLEGCDGINDTPAYFFRTTFTVDSLEGMTKLTGTLQYDDAATVYVNGVKIAGFDDSDITANLQYGGSNAGTPKTVSFEALDLSILHAGKNTIAVEIHQGRVNSSDIWFYMTDLSLSDEEVEYQSNISLSMGADESQMNFTWYSPLAIAKLMVADNAAMDGAQTIDATTTVANDGQYSCKATATGLQAGTTYYYQLSNGGNSGCVYSFTTDDGGAFSFAFVGDPQIGAGSTASDIQGWDNTLNIIGTNDIFSDVSFLLSAGDQVNTAADEAQYDGYLDHDVLTGLPVATAIGNHDSGSNAYGQHFNVANESTEYGLTAAGGDYYFVYNNALFMVLNSNNQDVEQHKTFMQNALEATEDDGIRWKIVMLHHTLFTVASHAHDSYIEDENGFKANMVPVLKELDVDVVLMGHDHVYCRTYMMDGLTPMTDASIYDDEDYSSITDPTGILFVTANSGSGSKTYGILDETFPFSAVQNQENTANVSKVTVSDSRFTITTYRTSNMTVVDTFTINRTTAKPAKLLIDQVYGGGGKSETPISNSFIELYNPNTEAVDLTGYTLVYNDKTLELSGSIPANGSYLVVGEEEITTDEFLTYSLPQADKTCDWVINNKSYTITLKNGDTEIDSVSAGSSDATQVSKQKSLKRVNHADTDTDADFQIVVWEKKSVKVDENYVTAYAPRNSKGEKGSVYGASSAPTYTPVVTGNTRVNGYYDENGTLKLELAGRYNSGAMNADGGSLEIVQYNSVNGYAYAVSGVKGKLIAVNLNDPLDGDNVVNLTGIEYDLKSMVSVAPFTYGDMTSVAISPDGTKLAAALQDADYTKSGLVAVFSCNTNGTLDLLSTVSVGVQPDMVTFADNSTILTADEGEPRNGAEGEDPKGSVSIVTIGADNTLFANIVNFSSFDRKREELTSAGVLIQKGSNPSTDFEPEYIAVSGHTAYVSLQEANAIAVLDIVSAEFTGVYPLGFQDYGVTKVDLQKDDTIELKNYENVYGIRMPDGISVTTINGKTYLLTANEGDSRSDWNGLDNEYENLTSPTGNVTLEKKVVWFNANIWDGLNESRAYVFGGRSFSIYEVGENGLTLVYDSGSDFEAITAKQLPLYFNASNDKISLDNRSGKKGPEPETVVTGTVNGRTYAFIALERIGGVMVYDITDPNNAGFVNYINSREFDNAIQGDVSPEGLCFVSASDSKTGKALLLTACEVSGTLAVYELTYAQSGKQNTGSGSHGGMASSHPVSIASAAHGDVTISHMNAAKGDLVTLTVTPDKDYTLETLTVTDANSNIIQLTENNNKYTFTMPASKVTVKATFIENKSMHNFFMDVPSDAYYYDAVLWAVENGITNGTSDTAFSPNMSCTRAQAVTFLWRAAGSPAPKSSVSAFADINVDSYYYDAILWAVEQNITVGTDADTFSPDAICTRAQIVTFLWRAQKTSDIYTANPFDDVADDAYYNSAVLWAVENGVSAGTSTATFSPSSDCTRAQIVTFLFRCMK